MSYYDDICRPVASLEKGLNISELLKNSGTEFELIPDDDEGETCQSSEPDFNFEDLSVKLDNWDLVDIEECEDGDSTPFDKYRRKMEDVTEDGKLKKFIVKQGTGELVPDNGLVYLRYQAYVEYVETPFDSTLLQCQGERNDAVKFNLAKGELINGLHLAVLTMRSGEKAEFLIHHDLAYGRLGCPPRIPPEATVLFVVEVDSFVDSGAAFDDNGNDDVPPEERNKYVHVYEKAKGLYNLGVDSFRKQKNFSKAAQKFRIAINMMHNARLADEEEEKARDKFLMKLYTNCAICYDKLKLYKKTCIMAADAAKLNPRAAMKNDKLLFNWGRAKMNLGDYASARKHLFAAQKLSPKDKLIGDTILELMRREEHSKAQEKIMWSKAFDTEPVKAKIRELTKEEEAFRNSMTEQLTDFISSSRTEWTMTWQMTLQEEEAVLEVAKGLGLYARVADGEKRVIHIKKPNDD